MCPSDNHLEALGLILPGDPLPQPDHKFGERGSASLVIKQSAHKGYRERTIENARSATLTVAFALDFTTAGERLTKSAAGDRYIGINLMGFDQVDLLRSALITRNVTSLNIAGNGLYTLAKLDDEFDQNVINNMIFEIIMQTRYPITSIITGGQTGVDIAGAVAGYSLGIPTVVNMPHGFVQRNIDGMDANHTEDEIRDQIVLSSYDIEYFNNNI